MTNDRNTGAFVHRLSVGHTRTFFNVSLPNTWLEDLIDQEELTRAPDVVSRRVATYLTTLLQAASAYPCPAAAGKAEAATSSAECGEDFPP